MPKFDSKRLAKQAAGVPAELSISLARGNGLAAVPVSGGSHVPTARDGLISVLNTGGGTTYADITDTASFTASGSLNPGVDIANDQVIIYWYRFEH
jgi:hypothetical protein